MRLAPTAQRSLAAWGAAPQENSTSQSSAESVIHLFSARYCHRVALSRDFRLAPGAMPQADMREGAAGANTKQGPNDVLHTHHSRYNRIVARFGRTC